MRRAQPPGCVVRRAQMPASEKYVMGGERREKQRVSSKAMGLIRFPTRFAWYSAPGVRVVSGSQPLLSRRVGQPACYRVVSAASMLSRRVGSQHAIARRAVARRDPGRVVIAQGLSLLSRVVKPLDLIEICGK